MSSYDQTDVNGMYTLTVIAGTYQVSVSRSGYASPPLQQVTVPPSRTGVDFTFPWHYLVTGIVRDYDGTPLSGITVQSSPFDARSSTDSSGQYVLHLPAGLYCLSAYGSNLPEPPAQALLVSEQAGVDFTFPRRYTISGAVRDHDGTLMQNVYVDHTSLK